MIDSEGAPPQPQGPTNFQLAGLVAKDVELDSIVLKRAELESHATSETEVTELAQASQFRPSYELLKGPPRRLAVHMAFVLDLSFPTEPPTNVLHLGAEYALTYKLPETTSEYPPEALQWFAELNGTLNVWPYWRELVHTVVARVGLGSITLPVWRAQARPIEPRSGQAPTPGASTTS